MLKHFRYPKANSRDRQLGVEPGRSRTRSPRRSTRISWPSSHSRLLGGGEATDARDGHRRSPRLPLNANATDIADRKNPRYAGLKQLGRARERRLWRYPALRWRPLSLNFGMPDHWPRIVQVCVAPAHYSDADRRRKSLYLKLRVTNSWSPFDAALQMMKNSWIQPPLNIINGRAPNWRWLQPWERSPCERRPGHFRSFDCLISLP